MQMYHIAICDDEEYFRIREKQIIERYMAEQSCAFRIDLYPSGKEMLAKAGVPFRYDIVFLDISMEEMDGLETAKRVRELSAGAYIVFVTAYITYALEGYKVDAVRYLLKEDDGMENAFKECMDTITGRIADKKVMYRVDINKEKGNIPIDTILYVESRLHKVIFYVMEDELKEYYRYDKLDTVERELQGYGFLRIHQSFLVNMKHVKGVERYKMKLDNGSDVSISKKYYKRVEMEYIMRQGEI